MSLKIDIRSKLDNFTLNASFETKSNRIGILGESGAGKSMLLKYIAGIYTPDSGRIYLGDTCLLDTEHQIDVIPQERNIAYMFQSYALFPTMTVRENIEIIAKGDKTAKKKKADFLLKKFHIDAIASKKPGELSGGQQQRVALARVMAYEPKLILLDEPFSALDTRLKERLQIELEEMISDYDGMVIMVSHNRDELYKFSEEIIVISEGELAEQEEARKFFDEPNTVTGAKLVGIGNILPAKILDNNTLEIPEWNFKLKLKERPDIEINYVGIRDRDLIPMPDDANGDNVIEIQAGSTYESINKRKIFFDVVKSDNNIIRGEKEDLIGKYSFVMEKDSKQDATYRVLPNKLKVDIDKMIFFNK